MEIVRVLKQPVPFRHPRPHYPGSFIVSQENTAMTDMTAIPRKYITDARNQKQAVIIDIETFNRMESIIEDHGLGKLMEDVEDDEVLSVHEAKKHYKSF